MIIRDALEADLPAIVEIYNAGIRSRVATAQLEEVSIRDRVAWFHEHHADSFPLWVAEIEAQIAGWFSFHPYIKRAGYRPTAEVSIYVSENFRRRGVGKTLLTKAVAHAPRLGFSVLIGNVFAHNAASVRLFEQCGFKCWGFLPRVTRVDGVEGDVVIMGRHVG